VADLCPPFPRIRHCVTDSETDQPVRSTRPKRASLRLVLLAAAVAGVGPAGCGGGSGSSPAAVHPSAERPVRVGGTPVAVAVGEGGVWVVDNARSRVVELDPRSARPARGPIAVGAGPEAVAVGEGSVWVASGNDTVSRIDPESGKATVAPRKIADPAGIAAGEGSVWVTSRADGSVIRLDPRTLHPTGDPIPVGRQPADIAVGEGSVWVADAGDGTVTRIDAATGEAGEPIRVAKHQVLGLSVGEGGVWVAKSDDRLAQKIGVVRIDPATSRPDDASTEVPAAIPVRLATGYGGVWVTLAGGVRPPDLTPRAGRVALVDPESGDEAGAPLRVGNRPSGIAVGEGFVWVADAGDGTVTRIDPGA
jgi:streptogramin lyase